MAMSKYHLCKELRETFEAAAQFIASQEKYAKQLGKEEFWQRDMSILEASRLALSRCQEEDLRGLLDEMRGWGHFFGSYCSDQQHLDKLLDALYTSIQKALVDLRA